MIPDLCMLDKLVLAVPGVGGWVMFRNYSARVAMLAGAAIAMTSAPARAGIYKVVYNFQIEPDGSGPYASLIEAGGNLYGTTGSGGAFASGTVFSLNIKTGAEKIVFTFQNGPDGGYPHGNLAKIRGSLYGTTQYGGAYSSGTVFSVNPKTEAETAEYSFDGFPPYIPQNGLVDVDGVLFGTTLDDGFSGLGTLFSFNLKTGVGNIIYSFKGNSDGSGPYGALLKVGGTLYGTTSGGGIYDAGTVFSLNPKTGSEAVVYSFKGNGDGDGPLSSLIGIGSKLYGTTVDGGINNVGTVFSLDLKTGVETVVYSFKAGDDGAFPYAAVVDLSGVLYGTTYSGAAYSAGTIFAVNAKTGHESIVHSFGAGSDGNSPYSGLVDVGGTLYGTTHGGGDENCGGGCGTVFSYTP